MWNEMFLPLDMWVIYLGDTETDCVTHNVGISGEHDSIQIKIGKYL